MDILLSTNGDLYITEQGDISISKSIAQEIKIKLKWWLGEWRWDQDEGLPYNDEVFVKNPNTDAIEMAIREQIFEIKEITEVKNIEVTFDKKTRVATVSFTACTDYETISEEVKIDGTIRSN